MFDYDKYRKIRDFVEKKSEKTKIIAISKYQKIEDVSKAVSLGVDIFGENRVQEAKQKFTQILDKKRIELHLTGPLQTNKVKDALNIFNVFHTLDREKLLREFAKYPNIIKTKSFFIQVNTGKEISKSGVFPEDVLKFYNLCKDYGITNIEGLMCIPPINENPKKHFSLLNQISREVGNGHLSIGMSSDYLEALSFKPKYIRLGTILFGKRL